MVVSVALGCTRAREWWSGRWVVVQGFEESHWLASQVLESEKINQDPGLRVPNVDRVGDRKSVV